ncbi:MAG TPA: class I SAM-dependent methyltransferase, partial [Usitatibacter sp.]|nr:class I SAM-dependent methyltransferase [Usitatibacter sp.]
IDVSGAAIAHARHAYGEVANLEFVQAGCDRLPLGPASVDVAVSFETLEHIAEQEAFLDELARVLAPGGVLVLSCPNKREYSDQRAHVNEFHVKELYRDELAALVAARFPESDWYGQRPTFYSLIAPESPGEAPAQVVEVEEADPASARSALSRPLYFLVAASRERSALDAVPRAASVLADRGDWVHRDYEKVMRMLEHAAGERDAFKSGIALREADIAKLTAEVRSAQEAAAGAEARARDEQAARIAREADLAARDAVLAETQRELDARRGWRWWLKLPLVRLGILR